MMELQVVLERADWLVVNKPANMLIHPTRPDGRPTLWHALQEAYPDEALALINRLDRETSGLVITARNKKAASALGKAMMRREIGKFYFAIVHGEAPERGVIEEPIDRLGKYGEFRIYLKQGVVAQGHPCKTIFERIEVRERFSLLRVELETGRLHQIRVHLSHIGHPVVGDKIYGADEKFYLDFIERGWTDEMQRVLLLPRHALHACRVAFDWEGERVVVDSVLPKDLEDFWKELP